MTNAEPTVPLEDKVSALEELLLNITEKSNSEVKTLRGRIEELKDEASHETSVNNLIEIRDELSSVAFTLQANEAAYHSMYLRSEYSIKEFERRLIDKLSNAMEVNRAEVKAKLETLELRKINMEANILHEDFKGLRFTLKEYIDGLQQKIAALRKEEEHSRLRETSNA
jgi:hypothetical protein